MSQKQSKQSDIYFSSYKLDEDFQAILYQILNFASHGLLRIDFLKKVLKILVNFTNCDGIEVRLLKENRCYRYIFTNSKKKHFKFEIFQSARNNKKEAIPCSEENSELEQLCKCFFYNKFNSNLPYITKKRSLWIEDIKNHPLIQPGSKRQTDSNDSNINRNIRSIALLPLKVGNETIGLVVLKSKKKNFFSKYKIESYENFSKNLALVLICQRAQPQLRERVKELTCLYGITQAATHPNISLKEFLRIVAELLPPAWQYPQITHSRIVFDGSIYLTQQFRDGPHKQTANIIINNEKRGFVEVLYSENRPVLDEGPFLKEERHLIDTIARELSIIIERKQAEEDKTRIQEQLLHADRLATIGQLSSGIAHELNEPLNNILGFSQLIKKNSKLPKQVKLDIERIIASSLHAREIVRKLLIFARQMPTKKINVDLNQIVKDGIYFFESRCSKEGIDLICELTPDLPNIKADPAQLHQVLVNLVVNAIQSMPTGGKLKIQIIDGSDHISLIVEDSGTGMTKEVMKKIFLPFFSTKEIGHGTGLGLSVVHGIVTAHNGNIKVDSKVGLGSRFEIQFPINDLENKEKS